jgi:hypothetical protein
VGPPDNLLNIEFKLICIGLVTVTADLPNDPMTPFSKEARILLNCMLTLLFVSIPILYGPKSLLQPAKHFYHSIFKGQNQFREKEHYGEMSGGRLTDIDFWKRLHPIRRHTLKNYLSCISRGFDTGTNGHRRRLHSVLNQLFIIHAGNLDLDIN